MAGLQLAARRAAVAIGLPWASVDEILAATNATRCTPPSPAPRRSARRSRRARPPPVISDPSSTLPPPVIAGLMLTTRRWATPYGLAQWSVDEILAATDATRSRAYEIKAEL